MAETTPSPLYLPTPPEAEPSTTPPPLPGHPPAMTRMDTVGAVPKLNGKPDFDIVSTYQSLLVSDPDLTMPVAAIEALVLLLSQLPPTLSTISETLDLLATSTAQLKRSIPNPISLSAGTDLFQRYLVTTLRGTSINHGPDSGGDFKAIRQHLLSNGRLFVKRAKEARRTIASYGSRFVRDGSVVLTNGGSRVVGAVLQAAAEAHGGGSPRFKVIYVQSAATPHAESHQIIRALRQLSVPVATIPEAAVAYSMGKVTMVLVGAEGVVENGGIISRMGTYQMGILAQAAAKPMYVVAESHKFVRMFPLGQYDLPIEQKVLDFRTDLDDAMDDRGQLVHPDTPTARSRAPSIVESGRWVEQTPAVMERGEYFGTLDSPRAGSKTSSTSSKGPPLSKLSEPPAPAKESALDAQDSAVDYTPPDLITALITESGVHTPSAVSEELIKIWY
ncbi:translation initiation factor eIF-2B subunit alpha [Xylographa parallela]|nr:translation initiation factor eIF-2B subunit alpha [Xylographa parallela]